MPQITVDRHALVSAGAAVPIEAGPVLDEAGRPFVQLKIEHDGVRVLVLFAPNEAVNMGVGFLMAAGAIEGARQANAVRPAVLQPIVPGGRS